MKSTRKFYVGFNRFGTEFVIDSTYWHVYAFDSKAEREEWLKEHGTRDGKEVAMAITSKEMKKILPCGKYETRRFELDHGTGLVEGTVYPM